MDAGLEHIGKKSVAWSYVAVVFSVGSGIILLPFILHNLPSETVAVWGIFQAIYSMTTLLDFGFRPSFSRNISYIFSGVEELCVDGISSQQGNGVSFPLLKGTIKAMRVFYTYLAIAVLLLLLTVGSFYFYCVMQKYTGDKVDAIMGWCILCVINCYNLYTLYYDSLMTGKGCVTRLQQITIVGQLLYISIAIGLIYSGFGLVAIVMAQLSSIIVKRILANRSFYTKEMKRQLANANTIDYKQVLRTIAPNSVKVGLTSLGGYVVNKSALFFGSLYIALDAVATYSITLQILDILARCGTMLFVTFSPKIAQCRAQGNIAEIRRLYLLSVGALLLIYIIGGGAMLSIGDSVLCLLGSKTLLLPTSLLALLLLVSLLEQNHSIAAGFIQAGNKIPFFIPSLISGAATVILLWLLLDVMNMGLLGLIMAPGIAQLSYNNWKWPSVVIKEIKNK